MQQSSQETATNQLREFQSSDNSSELTEGRDKMPATSRLGRGSSKVKTLPRFGLLVLAACSLTLAHNARATTSEGHNEQQQSSLISQQASAAAGKHSTQPTREPAASSPRASGIEGNDELASTKRPLSRDVRSSSTAQTETATDDIEALLDSNYLESVQQSGQQQPGAHADNLLDDANSIQTFKNSLGKTRRQVEQHAKSVDWWTKLAHKHKKQQHGGGGGSKQHGTKSTTTRPAVYREQALSQNALITIRYQLAAIRDKHRLLLQKSVPQLMALDRKLIDSYRLCLKKKMPLYAGMLYRTRDFVVRMANEVKRERQILEAMTKQIQKVLRHKLSNRTLVKDYNRQMSSGGGGSGINLNAAMLDLSTLKPLQQQHSTPSHDLGLDYELAAGSSFSTASNALLDHSNLVKRAKRAAASLVTAAPVQLQPSLVESSFASSSSQSPPTSWSLRRAPLGKRDNSQLTQDSAAEQLQPVYNLLSATVTQQQHQQQQRINLANGEKTRLDTRKHSAGGNGGGAASSSSSYFSSSSSPSKTRPSSDSQAGQDKINLHQSQDDDVFDGASIFSFASSATTIAAAAGTTTTITTTSTTRRPKPKSYAVHINEVNLKRELQKTQALIDRINASSHELSSVADDIIFLFKLTSGDLSTRKGLSASGKTNRFDRQHAAAQIMLDLSSLDPKRAKKVMLKSPFKNLIERYGKLTMSKPSATATASPLALSTNSISEDSLTRSTTIEDINMMTISPSIDSSNAPEMKPLFDPAEIAVYKDPLDLELGFETPATLEI